MANNSDLGMIPFCCRNGTILPPAMNQTKSVSAFQMPNEFNRTQLIPPQNWNMGEVNQDYQCAPPVRVSPSRFPNPTGLSSESTAIASWQVVCNKTESKGATPRCCVSFSAFFNDSVVPCNTLVLVAAKTAQATLAGSLYRSFFCHPRLCSSRSRTEPEKLLNLLSYITGPCLSH